LTTSVTGWHSYLKNWQVSVISGFHREVDENCALLGYYAASNGNFLPTFRDNLSVPSSGVKNYSQITSSIMCVFCAHHRHWM